MDTTIHQQFKEEEITLTKRFDKEKTNTEVVWF